MGSHTIYRTYIKLKKSSDTDFYKFFQSERQIHLKKHLKGSLCMAFKENDHERFGIRFWNLKKIVKPAFEILVSGLL